MIYGFERILFCKLSLRSSDVEIVGFVGAVPVFVAIHGVVATDECGQFAEPDFFHVFLQLLDERFHAFGGNVAAVGDGVHVNFFESLFFGEVEHGERMTNI